MSVRPFRLPPTEPVDDGTGATTSPIQYFAGSGIDASDDLWYFNGAQPSYYHTQITLALSSPPPSGSIVDWELINGADIVQLSGTGNTATLTSIGASDPAASPVRVRADVNGITYAIASLEVPKPDHFVHLSDDDRADATYGYLSYIHYKIVDQFNNTLPRRVDVNEQWTTDVVNDFPGSTWRRGAPGGVKVNPADFADKIGGEAAGFVPQAQAPQVPLGGTKVQHWGQDWYVGDTTPGKGQKVQSNTLQKYQDHARHENVVSPP